MMRLLHHAVCPASRKCNSLKAEKGNLSFTVRMHHDASCARKEPVSSDPAPQSQKGD